MIYQNIKNKKFSNNTRIILSIVLCLGLIFIPLFIVFASGLDTSAKIDEKSTLSDIGGAIATLLSWIAYVFLYVFGFFLTLIIQILVNVASFNGFTSVGPVKTGWVIVRDLCNMFFILILLVIAFGTILRIESYNAKKLLPKLLIMAVLINFSKTICGLIIDFSQVIMLTFVNSFAQNGAGNFVNMFKVQLLGEIGKNNNVNTWGLAAAVILGVFALLVTIIVCIVLVAVLIIRLVMLWIYTILSPIAFLGAAFPAGQKYASQWWSEFTKQVISGPLLAFFLWLALTTATNVNLNTTAPSGTAGTTTFVDVCATSGSFFCAAVFQKFIIVIGFLIGGLMVTQQLGGAAGSIAGKGMGKVTAAAGVGFAAGRLAMRGGKALGSFGVDKLSEKTKIDWNVARGFKRLTHNMAENKEIRADRINKSVIKNAKEGGRLSMLSHGQLAWENIRSWKGAKRFTLGKRIGKYNENLQEATAKRKKVVTVTEAGEMAKKIRTDKIRLGSIDQDIKQQELAYATAPEKVKKDEFTKLNNLKEEKKSLEKNIPTAFKELKDKTVNNEEARKLDENIMANKGKVDYYKVHGATIASAEADADIDSPQAKKISNISNAGQLGEILKEAIEEGNQGLIRVVSKKLTSNSDYNEMQKALGLGTGNKGMLDFAHLLQGRLEGHPLNGKANMTEQDSLSLLADIGHIGKNIGHYGAFGHAIMQENGRWREAKEDEAQEAQLAEMLKVQPQKFARDTNRLGMGYYDGPVHDKNTWKMSKAAIGYLKLNGDAVADQYKQTGQQNVLEHIATQIEKLTQNDIKSDSKLIEVIKGRASGKGASPGDVIKNIK